MLTSPSYDVYIYQVDNPSKALPIPKNKGREAMVYLSFIIDHWDHLPPYILFLHGHTEAWHQLDGPMDVLIRDLQVPILQEQGYISLRCINGFACLEEYRIHPRRNESGVVDYGNEMFPQIIDGIIEVWPYIFGADEDLPETLASLCCAQFAVTRDAIQWRDKEVYVRARQWLIQTSLHDVYSGRVFEKTWAYLMTGEPIV